MRTLWVIFMLALSSCAPTPAMASEHHGRQTAGWRSPNFVIEGHVRPGPPYGRQKT